MVLRLLHLLLLRYDKKPTWRKRVCHMAVTRRQGPTQIIGIDRRRDRRVRLRARARLWEGAEEVANEG